MSLAPDDPRHGTRNGYGNLGCRCDACRHAWAEDVRRLQGTPCAGGCGGTAFGRYRPGAMCRSCYIASRIIPIEERHGTEVGYSKGCRCQICIEAASAARRNRKKRVTA